MKFTINTPLAIHELGKRQNQEDAIYPVIGNATADDRLFLVCDGMGGHESGEVASNTVCQAMSKFINENANGDTFSDALLKQAIDYAYNALDEANKGHDIPVNPKRNAKPNIIKIVFGRIKKRIIIMTLAP